MLRILTTYSIRELEEITGVKAHTIRAWEKRYNIIQPERSCFNVRLYSQEDLEKLSNIAFLNNHGYKISKIASLSRSDIADHVTQVRAGEGQASSQVDMLSMALMDYNAGKVECIIGAQIRHHGLVNTMHDLIFPLLGRLGLLLMSGSMNRAHEMLFVDIVQQKLRAAIDQTPRVRASTPHMLLFTTVPGLLDIHRLYIQYISRQHGLYVVSFMNALRRTEIEATIKSCQAKYAFVLYDMSGDPTPLSDIIAASNASNVQLVICGNKIHLEEIETPPGTVVLQNMQDALQFLNSLVV